MSEADKSLEETKRIMERLVNTPPQPKGGKAEKEGEKKPGDRRGSTER